MSTLAPLEGIALAACIAYTLALLATKRKIRTAAIKLFGLLVTWFALFYLAAPQLGGHTSRPALDEVVLFVGLAAAYSLFFGIFCSICRVAYRRLADWWDFTPKGKRAAELAGIAAVAFVCGAFLLWFGWRELSFRAHAREAEDAVTAMHADIRLGATREDVGILVNAAKHAHVQLNKDPSASLPGVAEVWRISSPAVFASAGRALYVRFDPQGHACAVALRTLGNPDQSPPDSPPDKGLLRESP